MTIQHDHASNEKCFDGTCDIEKDGGIYEDEISLQKYERRHLINILEIGAIIGMMITAIWLCLESVKILSQVVK